MMPILARLVNDPVILLNRMYYELTGVSIRTLQSQLQARKKAFPSLAALAERDTEMRVRSITEALGDFSKEKDCQELAELFTLHGSDKSTKHDYHLIYAALLAGKRDKPLTILEVGICTSFIEAPTHTEKDGKPGPSLRAWRDWGPHFNVYGADIDRTVLFSDDRIQTFFVDQTDPASLKQLATQFEPGSFNLIVDDGLHEPFADINTLRALHGLLAIGGSLVIEDIREEYADLWKTALGLLPTWFQCEILQTKNQSLAVLCTRI